MSAPQVRHVRLRVMGDDDCALAELLAALRLGATASGGRVQLGSVSEPYANRNGNGFRLYVDAFVVDVPTATAGEPDDGDVQEQRELPPPRRAVRRRRD